MPSRDTRPKRPDDKRLKANRPPSKSSLAPRSRLQQLLDGDLAVEDLDDEEIARGRCRDKNGSFAGRPPKMFPRELHDAMRMEFQRRIQEKLNSNAETAIKALVEITQNKRAAAPARVTAANILLERTMGKVPDTIFQKVEVTKFDEKIREMVIDVEVEE